MRYIASFIITATLIILPSLLAAKNDIPYCKGTNVSADENIILQKLVPGFAKEMGCEVGNNCILKWDDHGTKKFSIAWKSVCGPIIDGIYQLGDEGKGSTFVCSQSAQNVCCWPLGYDQFKSCKRM